MKPQTANVGQPFTVRSSPYVNSPALRSRVTFYIYIDQDAIFVYDDALVHKCSW